jgi:hypothetical protein
MAKKLRSVRKAARKLGVARGLFKKVGVKLKMPKRLPGRGVRPPRRPRPAPPPGVKRLPSGRLPANARKWAGKVYKGDKWTPALAKKYPNGVRFTRDGYPDFGPYVMRNKDGKAYKLVFENGFSGRRADAAAANAHFNLPKLPETHTWHHHQDGKTLLAVPKDMHDAVRHAGGIALMGE